MPNPESKKETQHAPIRKIGLAVFNDGKIMMLRSHKNEEVFYFVGGKLEKGESDLDCLQREVKEELGVTLDVNSVEYLDEFTAPAHGKENTLLIMKLFKGILLGEPKPQSEIAEIQYFDSSIDPRYLTDITITKVYPWLKQQGYIK